MGAYDLRGRQFYRWTAVEPVRLGDGRSRWRCRCECGTEKTIETWNLTAGLTKSCGCWRDEFCLSHGHSSRKRLGKGQSSTYNIWAQMLQRCGNVNSDAFANYGGRGLKVCERWHVFETFLADMGERPVGKSLDRIDNDLGYSPDNCRWATPKEQTANRLRSSPGERLALRNRLLWARLEAEASY